MILPKTGPVLGELTPLHLLSILAWDLKITPTHGYPFTTLEGDTGAFRLRELPSADRGLLSAAWHVGPGECCWAVADGGLMLGLRVPCVCFRNPWKPAGYSQTLAPAEIQ